MKMVSITVSMPVEDRTVKRQNFLLAVIYSKGLYGKAPILNWRHRKTAEPEAI